MEYIVGRISGRFRHLDEPTLEMMRLELKCLLRSWGAIGRDGTNAPSAEGALPLWAEVEFLDNIVQFEIECNPFLYSELKN